MRIASNVDRVVPRSFFVPGFDADHQESEYGRLQACALLATGSKPSESRILALGCRLGGRDCAIEVGQRDPIDDAEVVAIIDLGRELPYGVFTTANSDAPALTIGKRVYSVTRFA